MKHFLMMQSLAGLMKQITEISSYSMVPYPNLLNKSARLNKIKICIGLLITKHSTTKKTLENHNLTPK